MDRVISVEALVPSGVTLVPPFEKVKRDHLCQTQDGY